MSAKVAPFLPAPHAFWHCVPEAALFLIEEFACDLYMVAWTTGSCLSSFRVHPRAAAMTPVCDMLLHMPLSAMCGIGNGYVALSCSPFATLAIVDVRRGVCVASESSVPSVTAVHTLSFRPPGEVVVCRGDRVVDRWRCDGVLRPVTSALPPQARDASRPVTIHHQLPSRRSTAFVVSERFRPGYVAQTVGVLDPTLYDDEEVRQCCITWSFDPHVTAFARMVRIAKEKRVGGAWREEAEEEREGGGPIPGLVTRISRERHGARRGHMSEDCKVLLFCAIILGFLFLFASSVT